MTTWWHNVYSTFASTLATQKLLLIYHKQVYVCLITKCKTSCEAAHLHSSILLCEHEASFYSELSLFALQTIY